MECKIFAWSPERVKDELVITCIWWHSDEIYYIMNSKMFISLRKPHLLKSYAIFYSVSGQVIPCSMTTNRKSCQKMKKNSIPRL